MRASEHRVPPLTNMLLRALLAQAMADYAELVWALKQELRDPELPVVGFGGSYGGMLATWFRMK